MPQIDPLPRHIESNLGVHTQAARETAALFDRGMNTQLVLHNLLYYACRDDIHKENRRLYAIRLLASYAKRRIAETSRPATFGIGGDDDFLRGCIRRGWPEVN